jgi:hypothetical protein
MLCVAAGVLLGFSSAAFASSGSAGEAAHARPVMPSLRVASSRLSGRLRVSVRHDSRVSASIVGGVSAVQGQLGFMAFVEHFDALGNPDFSCSGTVVSSNVVLTAGHCAVDESTGAVLDPSGYQVVTGAVDRTDTVNGRVSGVSRVIVDPAYNRAAMTNDAAMLVLSTPTTAPPIRLGGSADQYLEQAGTRAFVAGWGATYGAGLSWMFCNGRRPWFRARRTAVGRSCRTLASTLLSIFARSTIRTAIPEPASGTAAVRCWPATPPVSPSR